MTPTVIIFSFFAALSVICAILVIAQKNPMHSVLYLAFTVLAVSGLFFCLQADFLGAIQIVVYAGGIVVLYVFVIIVINLNQLIQEKRKFFPKLFIFLVPILLVAELIYAVQKNMIPGSLGEPKSDSLNFDALSKLLLTDYVIPFEVSSILLLAVLVGSIIIARKGYGRWYH